MNTKKVAINWGLVFDGLLFNDFNTCGRYKGMETAKRLQWLKDHPNDFTRLADIVEDKTDVRTDVIRQEVDSSFDGPCPDTADADKADDKIGANALTRLPADRPTSGKRRTSDCRSTFQAAAARATTENAEPETETTPLEPTGRKRGLSCNRRLEKLPAGISQGGRKLSPELMRIVLNNLKKCPILSHAAEKAGIHRKTLEYWIKCSAAGQDGYDVKWRGITARFHQHCDAVIMEAYDRLFAAYCEGRYFLQDRPVPGGPWFPRP